MTQTLRPQARRFYPHQALQCPSFFFWCKFIAQAVPYNRLQVVPPTVYLASRYATNDAPLQDLIESRESRRPKHPHQPRVELTYSIN